MAEKPTTDKVKLALGVLGTLGTIIAFLFGVFQFSVDSVRRAESAAFEARKPFLTKQMELCLDATETAAILASTRDKVTWEKARERFWVNYWGPLSIVETPLGNEEIGPVEKQMVKIGAIMERIENNPILPAKDIEQDALDLAHHCRDLILTSWQIR